MKQEKGHSLKKIKKDMLYLDCYNTSGLCECSHVLKTAVSVTIMMPQRKCLFDTHIKHDVPLGTL